MKKILVPTDFSDCSSNAVDFAIQSAKMLPVEVTLLHAFELTGSMYTDYMGVDKEFKRTMLNDAHKKLDEIKMTIRDNENITVGTEVYHEDAEAAIIKASVDLKADLIIMGTSGASGVAEKLWGSKTADVIGKSKVPVLAIPENYEWKKPANILLLTNHFEEAPEVLNIVFEMAELYLAGIKVVVFTDDEHDKASVYAEHEENFSAYEKKLREMYKDESITVKHLHGKSFENTLQDYISENGIDMIAMITYQRSFLSRVFHPSTTKRMSYHTHIPLLAIPAMEKE